ncbi:phosphate regulon transcriptional regulator PhoB [Litorimonas sp.]|jgi:two-component system phosphate regulon response regulator PhoB|uniref:phosphate regulon transcriptional regulator PhoB n=1 Tax=Litorimonas sp. TaxID=1892381 RepID=UPI003A87B550
MKPFVLIVEDEDALSTLLEYNFSKEGYETAIAEDGEEALLIAEERSPDLILLDWMLPKLSGVEVCRRLRRRKETVSTPIIMLTARGDETDKVTGLDYGADDYLVKPFSMPELFARTRSLLRRAKPSLLQDIITQGDIEVDMQAFRVKRGDNTIHLGPTEFRLLEHFIKNPGRVFSREQLLDAVWGRDVYVEARTVDVHIGRLRKALGAPKKPDPIRTVRSAGYAFEPKLA